jgi:hypothetical protein
MELLGLVFNRRVRRAVRGLEVLRRSYEHLLVTAVLEGSLEVRRSYYQDYVDALEIIGARAEWVAKAL